jgi:hypothetical protein
LHPITPHDPPGKKIANVEHKIAVAGVAVVDDGLRVLHLPRRDSTERKAPSDGPGGHGGHGSHEPKETSGSTDKRTFGTDKKRVVMEKTATGSSEKESRTSSTAWAAADASADASGVTSGVSLGVAAGHTPVSTVRSNQVAPEVLPFLPSFPE